MFDDSGADVGKISGGGGVKWGWGWIEMNNNHEVTVFHSDSDVKRHKGYNYL
jgi:hypothetical protein